MATGPLQRLRHLRNGLRSRVSRQVEIFVYWAAMTSLAIATLYLWYSALSSSQTSDAMDLGWGASTPRWLVECLPPSLVALYLAEAAYSRSQGVRSWKSILLGVGLLCSRGIKQWLPSLWTFQRH
jgi:hypothetical protein